ELWHGDERGLAVFNEVVEQRHVNLASYAVDLLLGAEGFDKQYIRTSRSVRCAAPSRIVETSHGQGIRTRNNHQILVSAGVAGGAELDHHLSKRHHFLTVE